ncbi:MAG: hypothetical protein IPO36_00845 [Anaerolineales bacterium]|uniref:hypothetical protein n=1 Tax=Candidatus Villigracilis affinis TaxID=3140682 RepID=UPI001DB62CD8|nr:hypothetical protein [Anaerolineales bacterium]MBK9600384.1 hypothetical protein [Anaerolineales bacterium]
MKKYLIFGCLIFTIACQAATPAPVESVTPIPATQTPPPPATPTQTFTPAPTLTSTPVPMYFSEEYSTDMSAWSSFQTGGKLSPTLEIVDDRLRIDLFSPNTWYYAIHNSHEYQDVFVSAKYSGTPSGSAGLICRYSENGWFEYNINSDGSYSVLLGQWIGEGIATYTPIINSTVEYITPGMDYEIGLTCQGTVLLLHVNGKMYRKIDVARYELTSGKVGISAASFEEAPAILMFDWFKVNQPE